MTSVFLTNFSILSFYLFQLLVKPEIHVRFVSFSIFLINMEVSKDRGLIKVSSLIFLELISEFIIVRFN